MSISTRFPRPLLHQHLHPLLPSPFEPVDLQAFPTFKSFLTQFLEPLPLPLPEGCEVGYWSGSFDRDTIPRNPATPHPVDALESWTAAPDAAPGAAPGAGAGPASVPPLVPPADRGSQSCRPASIPGAGIVPLVANCLTQLSGGLVVARPTRARRNLHPRTRPPTMPITIL